jgi:predicted nucleotidyltransferase
LFGKKILPENVFYMIKNHIWETGSVYEQYDDKQDIFKKIKTEINKHINSDVYVFGSHNHGYSDEESDYDVIIFNENYIDITKQIRNEVGVKVDILFGKNNLDYVAIP